MRPVRTLLALSLLAAAPALATTGLDPEDIAAAEGLRERAMRGSAAWNVVESLTTEVGPRLAGTAADAKAVEWAKAKMQAMGFDKVYLEPVTFPVWLRHHERAEVLAPYPQPLVITALGGSIGTGETPIEAEVVAFANLDAANASYNLVRNVTDGVGIGPILMGLAASAHVLTPSATVRRVVNMTAIAAVDAQIRAARG
jgi:hypothetical protein